MSWREEFTHAYWGSDTKSHEIVDMSVDFLFELAKEEAPFRHEEESEDMKEIIYAIDAYEKSERLKKLRDEWDISKVEPLDIKKEGTLYTIKNGFHRIRVAKDLGVKTLKVDLQEGKFQMSKHINLLDLIVLINMLQKMFAEYKTLKELEDFLTSNTTGEIAKMRAKHMYISYGNM